MIFANHFAHLGSVLLLCLIAIYFLKRKQKIKYVSTLLLWRQTTNTIKPGKKLKVQRLPPIFFIEFAILSLLVLAALNPLIPGENSEPIAIVLDTSVSMTATSESGESSLQKANQFINNTLRFNPSKIIKLYQCPKDGPITRVIDTRTHNIDLRKDCDFSSFGDSLSEGIQLARRQKAPRIIVITDKPPKEEINDVDWYSFGSPLPNKSISSANLKKSNDSSPSELFLRITSYPTNNTSRISGNVKYYTESGSQTIPFTTESSKNGTSFLSIKVPNNSTKVSASLDNGGSLKQDDHAQFYISVPQPLSIFLSVKDETIRYCILKVLNASGFTYNLENDISKLRKKMRTIAITDTPNANKDADSTLQIITGTGPLFAGPYLKVADSPLLSGADFSGLSCRASTNNLPGEVILYGGKTPLISQEISSKKLKVSIKIASPQEPFLSSTAFPIFLWNFLDLTMQRNKELYPEREYAEPFRFPMEEADTTQCARADIRSKTVSSLKFEPCFRSTAHFIGLIALLITLFHSFYINRRGI